VGPVTDLAVDDVLSALRARGAEAYLGEPVTVTEHSLQAAAQAEADDRPAALVVAALLHDVGWLLHAGPRPHEERGAAYLAASFGPEVTEPVRLHVAAKRYLCAVDQEYYDRLSDASRLSLRLQGGPFTTAQARKFEEHPCFEAAIKLRRWDEEAKIPQLATPPLEQYLDYARTVISLPARPREVL
jgi:gamma-butyrobetaine dioxygenase